MAGLITKILGIDEAGTLKKIRFLGNAKNPDGIPALIKYLAHENVEYRRAACSSLEHHWMTGHTGAITALTGALGDGDARVRKEAAVALGEYISQARGAKVCAAARQAMVRQLEQENDEGAVAGLVVGLARVPDPGLAPLVAAALGTKDKRLVRLAIDAIGNLPESDARIELKKALRAAL